MLPINKKIALIIGHPGHELRIFRFLEIYQPRVTVLTDGSGNTGAPRTPNTIKILQQCGCSLSPIMGHFTDKEIYRIILTQDVAAVIALAENILADLIANDIDIIIGDAMEGFNPTHDLCRYLINILVPVYAKRKNTTIPNYDFLLDSMLTAASATEAISIPLTSEDFNRKREAALGYTELAYEYEHALAKYGTDVFKTEYLQEVKPVPIAQQWKDSVPFYEKYASAKIKEGIYQQAITFNDHLLPLMQAVTDHFEKRVN